MGLADNNKSGLDLAMVYIWFNLGLFIKKNFFGFLRSDPVLGIAFV